MYDRRPLGHPELLQAILAAANSTTAQSTALLGGPQLQSFLMDLSRRFAPTPENPDEENLLPEILGPVILSVARELINKKMTMSTMEWREPVRALLALTEIKPIAAIFTQLDQWAPSTHPALFEMSSLLGPAVRISCFPDRFVRSSLVVWSPVLNTGVGRYSLM